MYRFAKSGLASFFLAMVLITTGCDSNSGPSGCENGVLQTTDISIGVGPEAMNTSTVLVDYTGRLENGDVFDDGMGVQFSLASVITGFREGIVGMRLGGERQIVIPPDLAYGETGIPGVIPSCETLTFYVRLLDIVEQ